MTFLVATKECRYDCGMCSYSEVKVVMAASVNLKLWVKVIRKKTVIAEFNDQKERHDTRSQNELYPA